MTPLNATGRHSENTPVRAELCTVVIDSVEFVPGVTDDGESVQPTPVGDPEMLQDNATDELNPLAAATEMVEVPELPAETVTLAGDALKLNGASVIVVAVEVEDK